MPILADMTVEVEKWPLREPFRFAGFTIETLETVLVTVSDGVHKGRGEGVYPVVFDVTMAEIVAQLEGARKEVLSGGDAEAICRALGAGPARNALDCALWDLRAKASGRSIWDLAQLKHRPDRLAVDETISLGRPSDMAEAAARSRHSVLKVKLDAELIVERVAAIRAARPDAELIVDANQSWSVGLLARHAASLAGLGVAMIEQPLRVGDDGDLAQFSSPIPLFADESCHTRADLPRLKGLYQGINIKLDKTGGLTEALALAAEAKAAGMGVMVGCMAGTSLSMAPAYVIGSLCRWVDLDGPLLLAGDRAAPMTYSNGMIDAFSPALWG